MDVKTIEMPRHEAREKLRHYRAQVHKRADAEYQAALEGFEALAEGRAR